MLTAKLIESYVRPFGFKTKVVTQEDMGNSLLFEVKVTGTNVEHEEISHKLAICIPKPIHPSGRVFEVQGAAGTRTRAICYKGYIDDVFQENKTNHDIVVRGPIGQLLDFINDMVSESLIDWRYGKQPPADDLIYQKLETWLNTNPVIMDIDLSDSIKIDSVFETIVLHVEDENMSHNSRIFYEDWLYKLDPCSTPTSEKINTTYRLCKGAKVVDSRIVPSTNLFCSTITDNAISCILNPRRSYLLRTTFTNTEKLVKPEDPIIKPLNNKLHGVNLLTAIMHFFDNTFEDCIAISRSAAYKLSASVKKQQTIRSSDVVKVLVEKGQIVNESVALVQIGEDTLIYPNKIYSDSIIANITIQEVIVYGHKQNSVKIEFESIYTLQNGDKLSNRSAVKGVVKIIDDNQMPTTANGTTIEVCVSPESVYRRRSMSFYWEMMASKAIAKNMQIEPDLFNPKPTFTELVDLGFGSSEQLKLKGFDLPEKTFIGHIYWLRLNKHSKEIISYKGNGVKANQYGVLVDDANISGQRIDLAKSIAMVSRNMGSVVEHLIKENVIGLNRLKDMLELTK